MRCCTAQVIWSILTQSFTEKNTLAPFLASASATALPTKISGVIANWWKVSEVMWALHQEISTVPCCLDNACCNLESVTCALRSVRCASLFLPEHTYLQSEWMWMGPTDLSTKKMTARSSATDTAALSSVTGPYAPVRSWRSAVTEQKPQPTSRRRGSGYSLEPPVKYVPGPKWKPS